MQSSTSPRHRPDGARDCPARIARILATVGVVVLPALSLVISCASEVVDPTRANQGKATSPSPGSSSSPANQIGGGVQTGSNQASATPGSSPSPAPGSGDLVALQIVPATLSLDSDPLAPFDKRGMQLSVVARFGDSSQRSTTADWSASPTGSVVVSASGYVSVIPGAPDGEVILKASSGSLFATASATVKGKVLPVQEVQLSAMELALFVPAGDGPDLPDFPTQATLSATVIRAGGPPGGTVTWSSSDDTVASVDSQGRVKALKAGKATIQAKSDLDPSKVATCQVTVQAKGLVDVMLE